jgi:2-polyprenyl-3-methyl-5-hydroxy-6-metoxy-1,4-benzoquinol methylase
MTAADSVNPPEWGGDETGALNGASGEGLAQVLVGLVRAQPGVRTICDLGCGNGYLAHRLGEAGYDVTGFDASAPYIETARRLYASEHVRFERALFNEMPSRQQFDLVISSDVIEHLYRPAELLQTASSLLKPGGVFIIGTPYHGYLKNLAIAVLGKWDAHHGVHWDGGHIKFFSVASLRAMLEANGFSDAAFTFYGRAPGFWKNMIATTRRR